MLAFLGLKGRKRVRLNGHKIISFEWVLHKLSMTLALKTSFVVNWGKRFYCKLPSVVRILRFIKKNLSRVKVKACSLTECEIFLKMKNNHESSTKVVGCTRNKVACDMRVPYLLTFLFSLVIVGYICYEATFLVQVFHFIKLSLSALSKLLLLINDITDFVEFTHWWAVGLFVNFVKTESPLRGSGSRYEIMIVSV